MRRKFQRNKCKSAILVPMAGEHQEMDRKQAGHMYQLNKRQEKAEDLSHSFFTGKNKHVTMTVTFTNSFYFHYTVLTTPSLT